MSAPGRNPWEAAARLRKALALLAVRDEGGAEQTLGVMSWHAKADETLARCAGNCESVTMRTRRDDTGIDYEVVVADGAEVAYEQGDNEYTVWSERVTFGATDATVAGGLSFRDAARRQQLVADVAWAKTRREGTDAFDGEEKP